MRSRRRDVRLLTADLSHLLDEWDPLGVADDVDDEYGCLSGLDPTSHGVDRMADRLVAWAAVAVRPPPQG